MCISKLGPTSSSEEPQTSPQPSRSGGLEGGKRLGEEGRI
jgi:hypothetical protein